MSDQTPGLRPWFAPDTTVVRREDGLLDYAGLPDTVVDMLRDAARRFPDREAIVEWGGRRLTYAELLAESRAVAAGLRDLGIVRGDRVAINLANSATWVVAFWGVLLSGAVVVPVNTRLQEVEVAELLEDSGARLCLDDPDHLPSGEVTEDIELDPASLAAIFYTSGTTGKSKGAMLTHAHFVRHAENYRVSSGVVKDEPELRSLVAVPMFHTTGCNGQLLMTTEAAGTVVMLGPFTGASFLETVETERITDVMAVPSVFWLVVEDAGFDPARIASLRRVTYGGAPITPALVRRLHAEFPQARLSNAFGLTESFFSTFLPHEMTADHADSVGLSTPIAELDIRHPDPVSGIGEIAIRGAHVFDGYWDREEATRQTFDGQWFLTGDLGRIDDEGLVYLLDRRKDMVNRGGENVYSVEVESVLIEHELVREAAVLGVPDPVFGEKVGAILVVHDVAEFSNDEFIAFCEERLADYKVPEFLIVQTELLTRNPAGKVDKKRLRDQPDWSPVGREARRLRRQRERERQAKSG